MVCYTVGAMIGLTPSILTVHLKQSSNLHWSSLLSGGPSPPDHDTIQSQPLVGQIDETGFTQKVTKDVK